MAVELHPPQPAGAPEPVADDRPTVHLVATPGGHLDLLLALRSVFDDFRRVWVVCPGTSADSLAGEGEEVRLIPRYHGASPESMAKARKGLRLAQLERPSLVVTSGSGCVLPFCLGARALGARLVYMETMARITDASRAGRLLGRFAEQVMVQWPSMREFYPDAQVCRPALLDGALDNTGLPRTDGTGTFVAVGTHIDPFDRILRVVEDAVGRGLLPGPAFGQTGVCSYRPPTMETERWLRPEALALRVDEARYFVCHAGSGLIARALRSNIRPIIVPRKAENGEHVDDHQRQLADRLGRYGLVVPVDGDEITQEHLELVDRPWEPVPELEELPRLQDALSVVAAPAALRR